MVDAVVSRKLKNYQIMNTLEIKAIEAMTKVLGNKFTLQPEGLIPHRLGYLTFFYLSNGDQYIVKVYDDSSGPEVYKMIFPVS